jgi:hypothetical protein
MKDFAAGDLQAADLLALARLDDDGAPPAAATRPRPCQHRAAPVHIPDGSAPRPPSQAALLAPRGQPGSRPAQ